MRKNLARFLWEGNRLRLTLPERATQEIVPGPKSSSGKLEIAWALGANCDASHGRLVSYVAGSTPGQAQPTHAPAESS